MTLEKSSRFKFINRKKKQTAVIIPGWATDYKIFAQLEINYNYLLTTSLFLHDFDSKLIEACKEHDLTSVSLFGVSLGGFLASRFAALHPRRIEALIMVGIRQKYPAHDIEQVIKYVTENKKAYLYKFYCRCFRDTRQMAWFKSNLLDGYLDTFETEYLLETLHYLKCASLDAAHIPSCAKIQIVHGERDRIAPIEEARQLAKDLPNADFICVKNAGHFPFLNNNFPQTI